MELTSEQQIQQLNEEYRRKMAEIKGHSVEELPSQEQPAANSESAPSVEEHQAISQATEDLIKKEVPEFQASSHEPDRSAGNITPEMQAEVQQRINTAFTKGPHESIKGLKDADIALVDEFHRAITHDAIYQEMVKQGKLPELK